MNKLTNNAATPERRRDARQCHLDRHLLQTPANAEQQHQTHGKAVKRFVGGGHFVLSEIV